jgi:hypothetical protein
MQRGGETLGVGTQGCIYYPKLSIDEHGVASESKDTTQVTKLFFNKADFDIENFFLRRVNEVTGGVGVVTYYGSDRILSFSNPGEITGCQRAISILELPLIREEGGKQLLEGVPLEEISPLIDTYLSDKYNLVKEGSPEEGERINLLRAISAILKTYNIPPDSAGKFEKKHASRVFIGKYKKYQEILRNGPPSIYCIHMKKISGNLTTEKLPLRNFKDAFEAFLKISHNNIIHCDLSFGNLFHDNKNIIIGDFGNAFDIISDNEFKYFRTFFSIRRVNPVGVQLTEEDFMKEIVQRTFAIGEHFSIELEIALKLFFLWDIIDMIKEAIDKPEYNELTKKTKHIIKYIVSITKEQLIEFIHILLKHSNLKTYISIIYRIIDIPEERSKYLVDQFTNFENYDSFYEVLSEVEGQVAPPEDIVPILAEKRNEIIKIIGPPSQGGRRRKAKTGKRRYKKRVTRRMRR